MYLAEASDDISGQTDTTAVSKLIIADTGLAGLGRIRLQPYWQRNEPGRSEAGPLNNGGGLKSDPRGATG